MGNVLVLGAAGFIGQHITIALRDAGHKVLACARDTRRLTAMGFDTLQVDLTDPASHSPDFWRPHGASIQTQRFFTKWRKLESQVTGKHFYQESDGHDHLQNQNY